MQHNAPDYINVKFYTSCQSSSEAVKESNECSELKIGEEVEFQVKIVVNSCPEDRSDWNQTFRIFPTGSQEAALIHLEMSCDCSCEHQEHHVSNILLKSALKLFSFQQYLSTSSKYYTNMLIEYKYIVL
jgi:protocadherin alpha